MDDRKKAVSALLAIFPTPETLQCFIDESENKDRVESFLTFAVSHTIIKTPDINELLRFISQHKLEDEELMPPDDLTLEQLMERKDDVLHIHFSIRGLTERINRLITQSGIELPKITNTMLTRLKREPADTTHKRDALRVLAFWLGYERHNLGPVWNFETLLQMGPDKDDQVDYDEGVRIGFALYSRGEVIGNEVVNWLKKELNDYIREKLRRFLRGNWGVVKSYDITTLYVDFPKESLVDHPKAFRRSIRNAISVAHQIAIRWALSPFCTQRRFLAIGICAGSFGTLDNYLQPILNVKLPGDPVIRMTDFVRQCVLLSDIRTVFNEDSKEIVMFNNETFNVWWVVGLWSAVYWEFVPDLLKDELMQNTNSNDMSLIRMLGFPDQKDTKNEMHLPKKSAVNSFFRFPQNTLLGIEIAKTLFYRKKFWEAIEIIRMVLSIDPVNVDARSLKMMILRNLGMDADSCSISQIHFKRAELEAQTVKETCQHLSEDFLCEYGVLKLARALTTLRYLQQNQGKYQDHEMTLTKEDVFDLLVESTALFEQGIGISSTGFRSSYLLACVKSLRKLFKQNEDIFKKSIGPILDPDDIISQTAVDLVVSFGWLRPDLDENLQFAMLEQNLFSVFSMHNDSVSLRAYWPTLNFCFAVVMWDFYPFTSVGITKKILRWLKDASDIAKQLKNENIFIYSYTRCHGEMLPADIFLDHIQSSIRLVEEVAGPLESLQKRDDSELIDMHKSKGKRMLTLNI